MLAVATVALAVFTLIAFDVGRDGSLTVLDARINTWLHHHGTPGWIAFFLWISNLHSNLVIAIVMAAVLAYLWFVHTRRWIATFALTVFGGMLLNFLLKLWFARERPFFEDPIITPKTYSFPSGHTLLAAVFYTTLCAFAFSRTRGPRLRACFALLGFLMIGLVGFSRMYLGAHYLSDVVAAFLEGIAWVAISLVITRIVRTGRRV